MENKTHESKIKYRCVEWHSQTPEKDVLNINAGKPMSQRGNLWKDIGT